MATAPLDRDAALFRRVQLRAARLEPAIAKALLDGLDELREILASRGALADLIAEQTLERFIATVLDDQTVDRAFARLAAELQQTLGTATRAMASTLPAKAAATVHFDVLSPHVLTGIRQLNTRVMTTLKQSVRDGVRRHVELGLQDGQNPRAIARGIRHIVGLAPNQVDAVANFRRALEGGPRSGASAKALDYKLRDRRFDRTVERAILGKEKLDAAQVDRMVDAYRQRMLAFHAETVARTAANDAVKLGHRLSYQDAIANGAIDPTRLVKRWSTARDDRVRPTHVAMQGEVVPHDSPFSNGQMIPGEDEYNCRCLAVYFVARKPRLTA